VCACVHACVCVHVHMCVCDCNPLTTGIYLTTNKRTTVKHSPIAISRLQARYLRYLSSDWPHYYVRLALVKGEKVTRADKNLEEITRLTLQGQVDEILLKKEQLGELRDIFHYQNKPCPRLILIMGGPGEYYKVLAVVVT